MFGGFAFGEPKFGDTDVSIVFTLNLDSGSYAITGSSALILASRLLALLPGTYSISGAALTLQLLLPSGKRITIVLNENRSMVVPNESRLCVIPADPI